MVIEALTRAAKLTATNREEQWLLPDGVEEILPERAAVIESLRRELLDLFASWGYQLVFPPLIEFLDSLLNGAGRDLERETFKLTDQKTGRLMGIRPDITPQVARIDAHSLRRSAPTRLCYCSTAVRTRAQPGGSRTPYQIGVELFGHAGVQSDAEVISLLLDVLQLAGARDVTLDLGHVGIYRALVRRAGLSSSDEAALSDIYLRKARDELDAFLSELSLTTELRDALAALPWLVGDASVLATAREWLAPFGEELLVALDELAALASFVVARYPNVHVHIDAGELRGYHYHTGCLFAAYVEGSSEPLAKGGRYDHIGEVFGRARPATGFSADLRLLAAYRSAPAVTAILAEGDWLDADFAEQVRRLRADGEHVLVTLPGADNDPSALQCDRRLVLRAGSWTLESL
ncbi:MAG: ATP phosphoribosyltransferase regulatory subunit [Gammaproteobacteria bacterium HGW-Gammaproteobacteria-14]|nr:MAG: ATP phosphoribosyltransferase regulatory subunit [Gammaproteobacteria bacterium HGW-Gammaproteobacteria-14]